MAENARASPTCNPRDIDMLELTGSIPCPGKINLIKKLKKITTGFLTLRKSTSLQGIKGHLS
jgi:hypothetical protein